jgi:hypothetical protein
VLKPEVSAPGIMPLDTILKQFHPSPIVTVSFFKMNLDSVLPFPQSSRDSLFSRFLYQVLLSNAVIMINLKIFSSW